MENQEKTPVGQYRLKRAGRKSLSNDSLVWRCVV